MKAMNPVSARALTWLAVMIMVVGFLVISPSGAFFSFTVAVVVAAIPAIFGSGKMRVVAAVILLTSIGLAASKYADFKSEQERYRQHAKTSSAYRHSPVRSSL